MTHADTRSVTGKIWRLKEADERVGLNLSQKLGVSEIVGRILASRAVDTPDAALPFLSPRLKDLPDPGHLLDMDVAVTRLIHAIEAGEKIAIFGDYDVDGGCASALLVRFFRSLGVEALLYIPDRTTEGYGPNPEAMEKLSAMGAQVVITVDCGSVAFEPMARAAELGMDVIITDHHQTTPEKPACVALLNPNRVDETSPCTMLSGAGVAFYLVMALTRALREKGYFTADRPEPDNRALLDLVAVSTVCDMVPLTGPNRILVSAGLQVWAQRQNLGLAALGDVAGVDELPGTYHAGFVVGPRINAGGRVAECDLGARLLSTENLGEATQLAQRLDLLNDERKAIEAEVLEEALTLAQKEVTDETSAIVLAAEGWHEGVIGIVASRVKERYHKPTFIIALNGDEGKGSGRSVPGIDLGRAVLESKEFLLKGGGHKMAAGLSLKRDQLAAFKAHLNALVCAQADAADRDVFQAGITLDGFLSPDAIEASFMESLERLGPYGTGHGEPKFALSGVKVPFAKPVGADGSHLTLTLEGVGGTQVRGIAFRAMESDLGPFLMAASKNRQNVSVCGVVRKNEWNGRVTYQLQVADAYDGVFQA